ncbi:hypothetical protein ACVMB3_003215, partial [Sinorhizobium meliloti]
ATVHTGASPSSKRYSGRDFFLRRMDVTGANAHHEHSCGTLPAIV